MRYAPYVKTSEACSTNGRTVGPSDTRSTGLDWGGWLVRMGLACVAVAALASTVHRVQSRSNGKSTLTDIPLREDACVCGMLGDAPMVSIEGMPMRVFGIESRPANLAGAQVNAGSVAEDFVAGDSVMVSLPYSEADDDHLRLVAKVPRVCSLALDGTRITDAGLQHLRGMVYLETLSLGSTAISDAGAKILADVRSLRYLDLRRTRLTNESLVALAALRRLESLDLSGTQVDHIGLIHLSQFPNLQMLALNDVPVDDGVVAALQAITSLTELHLRGTGITESGLAQLTALPRLEVCDVDGGRLSRRNLEALRRRMGIEN